MTIGYIVPEIWYVTDLIVIFHFGLSFVSKPNLYFFKQVIITKQSIKCTYFGPLAQFNHLKKLLTYIQT